MKDKKEVIEPINEALTAKPSADPIKKDKTKAKPKAKSKKPAISKLKKTAAKKKPKPKEEPTPIEQVAIDLGLNEKQAIFCREYVVDYNGKQAAIRAGYAEGSAEVAASRLLSQDKVLSYVRELQAEQTKRLAISADWVVQGYLEIYNRCMQAKEVFSWDYATKSQQPTGEWVFDAKGAQSALDAIGKFLGMFTQKVEHSGKVEAENPILARVLAQINDTPSDSSKEEE